MKNSKIPHDLLLEIVEEKHQMLEKIMVEEGIGCWVVFMRETSINPEPVQNLVIGGDIVWESAFVFTSIGKFRKIALVGNFDAKAEESKGIWTEVRSYVNGISDELKTLIKEISPNSIAINYSEDDVSADGLSHGMYLKLREILPNQKFVSAERIIQRIRAKKTESELEQIKLAAQLTETINQKAISKVRLGMTEREIQWIFHQLMDEYEVEEAWQRVSCPAIDAGPEKEMGHVGPTDLSITKYNTLHNDFGIRYNGYCSDIQRMWFFGEDEEIPEMLTHAFETVRTAIHIAAKFIRPGVKGFEVDKIARDYVISRGYEEYKHALGHQVGTQAHDGGTILGPKWERYGKLPEGIIEEGNVFTLELYVKTAHFGMVSLEEMIIVRNGLAEFIVPPQEKFITISHH